MHRVTLVVGNGPIGSSIARSLSDRGERVVLVGGSDSILSSHRDVGRIARAADAEGSLTWIRRNKKALAMYADLQERSQVRFFHQCGSLCIGDEDFLLPIRTGLDSTHSSYETLEARNVVEKFPFLRVPDHYSAIWEPNAGYINPLDMIRANNRIHENNPRGKYINGEVVGMRFLKSENTSGKQIECLVRKPGSNDPTPIVADCVVVAAGGFTQQLLNTLRFQDGTPCRMPTAFRISKRTVSLALVEGDDLCSLSGMPCVKMQLSSAYTASDYTGADVHSRIEASSVYVLPPIKYPCALAQKQQSSSFVKIGGGANVWLSSDPCNQDENRIRNRMRTELETFMRSAGDENVESQLAHTLLNEVLHVKNDTVTSYGKPCFTTCSEDDSLQIVDVGRDEAAVFVVAVGQGKSAAPGPAIGEEAADIVLAKLS